MIAVRLIFIGHPLRSVPFSWSNQPSWLRWKSSIIQASCALFCCAPLSMYSKVYHHRHFHHPLHTHLHTHARTHTHMPCSSVYGNVCVTHRHIWIWKSVCVCLCQGGSGAFLSLNCPSCVASPGCPIGNLSLSHHHHHHHHRQPSHVQAKRHKLREWVRGRGGGNHSGCRLQFVGALLVDVSLIVLCGSTLKYRYFQYQTYLF